MSEGVSLFYFKISERHINHVKDKGLFFYREFLPNKLRYVFDEVQDNTYTGDIKTGTALTKPQVLADNNGTQGSDNFNYDAIGNLIKDTKERH